MAKKKSEVEENLYCNHCEHYGATKVCSRCTSVFNEETQKYLAPTKYKHVETEKPATEGSSDNTFGIKYSCGTCMFADIYYNDQPCKDCLESYEKSGCRTGWVDCRLGLNGTIDEVFKKKHDIAHPSHYESSTSVDNVNHPSHYADSTSIECIESMELTFGVELVYHFAVGNAYKYLWRHKNKGKVEEDLNKANWYYHKAKNLLESERGREYMLISPFESNKLSTLKFYIDDYACRAGVQLKEVYIGGETV